MGICRDRDRNNSKAGNILVDGRVRKDPKFPLGLMDVLSIPKIKKNYRVLYDVKGRFVMRDITAKQAATKLRRIVKRAMGKNRIPYIVTHDGRTIRYPDPSLNVLDTI